MKKIICIFTLIFCFVTYLNINKSAGAGAWLDYKDNKYVRVVSYHGEYVHEAYFYSYGEPGYSRAKGCGGDTVPGNWDTISEFIYSSNNSNPITFKIYPQLSCY